MRFYPLFLGLFLGHCHSVCVCVSMYVHLYDHMSTQTRRHTELESIEVKWCHHQCECFSIVCSKSQRMYHPHVSPLHSLHRLYIPVFLLSANLNGCHIAYIFIYTYTLACPPPPKDTQNARACLYGYKHTANKTRLKQHREKKKETKRKCVGRFLVK